MAEPVSRSGLKRDLKRETQRLLQHIDHASDTELRTLDGIIDHLAQLHTSEHGCKILCTKNGKPHVPWGTRYAPWWERVWKTLNRP